MDKNRDGRRGRDVHPIDLVRSGGPPPRRHPQWGFAPWDETQRTSPATEGEAGIPATDEHVGIETLRRADELRGILLDGA